MTDLALGQWELGDASALDANNFPAGVILGAGTLYGLGDVTGLGAPPYKDQDQDLGPVHGGYAGLDRLAPRDIQASIGIAGPLPNTDVDSNDYRKRIGSYIADLARAMVPRTDGTDLTLRIRRFDLGGGAADTRILYVRPREFVLPVDDDFHVQLPKGHIRFKALDPRVYEDVVTTTGPGDITVGGVIETYPKVVLTDFTLPVTVNLNGRVIVLDGTTDATEIDLDYMARTVRTGSGGNLYRLVQPGSRFGWMPPGANSFTVDGATAQITFQGAFLAV